MNTVLSTLLTVKRRNFLPRAVRQYWREDRVLPIGRGHLSDRPSLVAQMLQWLDVEPGQKVLNIGVGSGWTTALLADLVGRAGVVYAVDDDAMLETRRENCARSGTQNIIFLTKNVWHGVSKNAPYDRILINGGVSEFPFELLELMNAPGKMVVPVNLAINEVYKGATGHIERFAHYGYIFAPENDERGVILKSLYQS